ncbi:MAG: hypothetical protein R3C29_03105 [Dehalococcoidia bacterium]
MAPRNFDLNAPERDGEDTLDEQFSIVGDGTKTETGVPAGDYSVTETNPGEYGSIEECLEPNPNGEGVYTTVATPFGTSIDEPGKLIRFVFTNTMPGGPGNRHRYRKVERRGWRWQTATPVKIPSAAGK